MSNQKLLNNYATDLNMGMVLSKRYKIKAKIIFDNKDVLEINPTSIVGLSILHNYIDNFFPFVTFKFRLNVENYYKFSQYYDTVKIELELLSASKDNYNDEHKLYYDRIFKEKFKPIFENVEPNYKRNMEEYMKNTTDSETETIDTKLISVYLFKEVDLDINKKQFNFIAKDCNPMTAIMYMVNNSKVENLLISKPDNNERYRQLICPPLNLKNSLLFIQKYYGLYECGMRCYMDFKNTYIVSKDINNLPLAKNEYKRVYVYIPTMTSNTVQGLSGSYDDEANKRYVLTVSHDISIESASETNKETESDVVTFTSRDKINGSVFYDPETDRFEFNNPYSSSELTVSSGKNNKKKIIYNETNNPYIENEYIYDYKLSENIVTIGFKNIDIDILTLNKQYYLVFEDKEINRQQGGLYRIERVAYVMDNQNGSLDELTLSGSAIFSKVV